MRNQSSINFTRKAPKSKRSVKVSLPKAPRARDIRWKKNKWENNNELIQNDFVPCRYIHDCDQDLDEFRKIKRWNDGDESQQNQYI